MGTTALLRDDQAFAPASFLWVALPMVLLSPQCSPEMKSSRFQKAQHVPSPLVRHTLCFPRPPHRLQAQALCTAGASVLPHSIPSWPPMRSGPPLPRFPDRETEAERSRVNCLRLLQDSNGADLAPSNAMLSTIVPPSLLHGRAVLSPSPRPALGACQPDQSFFFFFF